MTLVELLLALAGTAVIGAALAFMLTAVTYASSESTDIRALVARNQTVKNRLDAAIRSSRRILAHGTDEGQRYLILWMKNDEGNDKPNLSEIRRINFNPAANELRSYRAPGDLSDEDDAEYGLGTVKSETESLMGTDNFPMEVWSADVTDWRFTVEDTLISYEIDMQAGELEDTAIGAASLRN